MTLLDTLAPLRAHGKARTSGLPDATVLDFAGRHPQLGEAIAAAAIEYDRVRAEFPELLDLDEDAQTQEVQSGFVNFYAQDAANPYVALAARGPWIVTLKGAVIYDTGGYGMLGLGHTPQAVMDAMSKPQAMANIMTPNVSQLRFARAMRAEIGQTRGGCPYSAFLCLNSGSESVSLASRIVDANAKTMTDPGARHAGKTIKRVVVKGAFHGRTERPALYSDSSRKTYVQHLASYRDETSVMTVAPYDMAAQFKARYPQITVWRQSRRMSEPERQAFLRRLFSVGKRGTKWITLNPDEAAAALEELDAQRMQARGQRTQARVVVDGCQVGDGPALQGVESQVGDADVVGKDQGR